MSKELEYIQRHIDIVKQQVKGSKMKIIVTDAVTKHQYDYYKNELQTLESIEKSLKRLEAIDNANPSEALECLEKLKGMEISSMPFSDEYGTQEVDLNDIRKVGSQLNTDFREYTTTIKQALIKVEKEHNSLNLLMQELDCKDFAELRKYARCGYEKLNKKYLKWEDLVQDKTYKVLLNGSQYELVKRYDDYEYRCDYITLQKKPNVSIYIYEYEKEIFNDLHLERVEE